MVVTWLSCCFFHQSVHRISDENQDVFSFLVSYLSAPIGEHAAEGRWSCRQTTELERPTAMFLGLRKIMAAGKHVQNVSVLGVILATQRWAQTFPQLGATSRAVFIKFCILFPFEEGLFPRKPGRHATENSKFKPVRDPKIFSPYFSLD
jgi:hypothetical protein